MSTQSYSSQQFADRRQLLVAALQQPMIVSTYQLQDWDLLIRQARAANMLGSLYVQLRDAHALDVAPPPALQHLIWADRIADKHQQAVRWEVHLIIKAFEDTGTPVVLLKGAAYVLADLPSSKGRLFSDIDLIVPKEKLGAVEAAMMMHGWESAHHDEYDQRYYRNWMHELPPMQHVKRMTVVDLHHAILPETAAVHPDSKKLLRATIPVRGNDQVFTLAPVDMVLHSMVHLFYEGEFHHGLRDLLDIHKLMAHFGRSAEFWNALVPRAVELELTRPLFYALRYARIFLHTDIPSGVYESANVGAPNKWMLALMDSLFCRALLPLHRSCDDGFTSLARSLLYIRANWLRMPPLLLIRHLLHKAFISPKKDRGA